jgi:membrane-associated protein
MGFIQYVLHNVPEIVRIGGLAAVAGIIFAETGLMIGFFLPGDSLLVSAGLLAAAPSSHLSIVLLNLTAIVAAIAGDATGYWIGDRLGQTLYRRENSFLFRRDHLLRTHAFYEKHGGQTIVIARFMPIIRTFAPVVAGAATMTYRRFVVYNVFGGVGWVLSMTLTGYYLGRLVPNVDRHIDIIVAGVIFLSLLPALVSWLRAKSQARSAPAEG